MGLTGVCTVIYVLLLSSANTLSIALNWLTVSPGMQPTGILTNSFVAPPASALSFLIFVGIGAYIYQQRVRSLWATERNTVLAWSAGVLGGLWLLDTFVLMGHGWGLASDLLVIAWFAPGVERKWGRTRLLVFCLWIVLVVNTLGWLLTWIWPASITPLFGSSMGVPLQGGGPLMKAVLTTWCLMIGRQRLALLNIEGYKLVWVLLAICGLDLLFQSVALGLMGAAAIGTAHLLIRGTWRPEYLLDRARLWRMERARKQRLGKFKVIDGGRGKHTLH